MFNLAQKGQKLLLTGLLVATSLNVYSADLTLVMTTKQGSLLRDAVVEIIPIEKNVVYDNLAANNGKDLDLVSISQKDRTFIPFVSVVPTGTPIDFPNMDKTRHHVYSFSPAKTFQLQLYIGKPETPIVFDKAGIVALGCNIHDFMESYVYVAESPFAQNSNLEGVIRFKDVPEGEYEVSFWHPWQDSEEASITITVAGKDLTIQQSMDVYEEEYPTNEGINDSY
ncbi:methylamine utilization protein [Marinomonas sp. PE14-40]|uniref:methylamine utilization protein n=1 Tax=Marinomonas sp. PE14-40 TaxID=3060621 RepID=UPI003F661ED0